MLDPLVSQLGNKGIGLMHNLLSHLGEITTKDALSRLCIGHRRWEWRLPPSLGQDLPVAVTIRKGYGIFGIGRRS